MLGTHNHGQGHATSLAQILSSKFGIPHDMIQIVEGDTDLVPFGSGTFGSRSIAVGGSALEQAAVKVIAKGRRIASHLLEAGSRDVAFGEGFYSVVGTNKKMSFAAVARAAHIPHDLPLDTIEPGLDEFGRVRSVKLCFQQRRPPL